MQPTPTNRSQVLTSDDGDLFDVSAPKPDSESLFEGDGARERQAGVPGSHRSGIGGQARGTTRWLGYLLVPLSVLAVLAVLAIIAHQHPANDGKFPGARNGTAPNTPAVDQHR